MHTCCSRNGLSVDRIWPTISLSYYIQNSHLYYTNCGYSGVSGGEASSRNLKCI